MCSKVGSLIPPVQNSNHHILFVMARAPEHYFSDYAGLDYDSENDKLYVALSSGCLCRCPSDPTKKNYFSLCEVVYDSP